MSQRETNVPLVIYPIVGGVNQRTRVTELRPEEYADMQGVFPEFAGLQSRLWGKRLLKKYPDPLQGIHQFWTPQGYGVGLYQFAGTIDYGVWITPTSAFNLNIPTLDFDGGNFTLDEFGIGYGGNFNYGDINACTMSFLGNGTNHSICNPPPSPSNTPNDSNGSPAGQGKKCNYQLVGQVITYGKSNYSYCDTGLITDSSGIEGPTPFPKPLTVTIQTPSNFIAGQGTYGANLVASGLAQSNKANIGGGNYVWSEQHDSYSQRATLDFSSAILAGGERPVFIVMTFARNPNSPFTFFDVQLPVSFAVGGNYAAFNFDPWLYLNTNPSIVINGTGGYIQQDFINGGTVTAYYNRKICI